MKNLMIFILLILGSGCTKEKEEFQLLEGNWMLNEQTKADGSVAYFYHGISIEYRFSNLENNSGDFSAFQQNTGSSTSDKFEISEDGKTLTIIVLSTSGANSSFSILELSNTKMILKNDFVQNTFYKL